MGMIQRASETLIRLHLAPGHVDEYVQAIVRAVSDPCDD